jgi:heterodisulfide reductase subunit B
MSASYTYFPGCSLKSTGRAYEESLLTLFGLLGLKLQELDDWNCCGATSYMSVDEESAFSLSARNLALAKKSGSQEVLAPCAACYLVLKKTQDYSGKYPEIRKHIASSLSSAHLPMPDGVDVRHPLEILFRDVGLDAIRSKVVRKWAGGPVACYYGCQVVRPYSEVDTPTDPKRMEEILGAAGIPSVPYSLKTKCCGGSLIGTIHEVGLRLNAILILEAARKGAKAIVTLCPLCQFNLDAYQGEIRKQTGQNIDMPIVYFTQLLGWALGGDPRALGLQRCIAGSASVKQWLTASKEVAAHV